MPGDLVQPCSSCQLLKKPELPVSRRTVDDALPGAAPCGCSGLRLPLAVLHIIDPCTLKWVTCTLLLRASITLLQEPVAAVQHRWWRQQSGDRLNRRWRRATKSPSADAQASEPLANRWMSCRLHTRYWC